ncbi:MAG: ROK family protein [Acidobacteriia bacterium]|nr:ROK family protein [Terriglobia bacterium]
MFASVDIGAAQTACALATGAGQMVAERTIPTLAHEGPDAVLNRVASAIGDMALAAGQRLLAVGVGVPGLADFHRGRALFLPNLPAGWRDLPVTDRLSAKLSCPVFLLNDARMAALGELWFGHGRNAKTMVVFTVGTGIGGGVVIDRRLRLGPLGAAGEVGHQTILPDGPLCGCGNRGCLETLASGPALVGEATRLLKSGHAPHLYDMVNGDADKITPRLMTQAAAAGDSSVREAIVRAGRFLGIGVSNVITVLNPELVVVGGELAAVGPLLIDTVRREVRERVRLFPVEKVRIETSALEDKAGLWGGIALAIARVKQPAGPPTPEGI